MTSGNVFADLGFDNSEEELRKAKLAREIRAIIMRRRLTQAKSAQLTARHIRRSHGRTGQVLYRSPDALPRSTRL
ncbi:hypothetical protein MesoLj131c_67650 (plasmid) [Mesorhizobium sp. 131-3-5]|uniref:XRE family transcriptional regulator n=1 Tax=Mesorhizobium sp. 131-3-5 TaxID=2744520 RepID=UPI001937EAC3|nr:XRE family transcriptional regulator [Mesorhizobium sp. 131-3-5]BCH12507.1 hypothetical protein MesoLj131c_67650 [Mesorhizobium sp. 131-3-5]